MVEATLSPGRARLLILLAALLWSTSGAFTKTLTQVTFFGLHDPAIAPFEFAGLAFPVQIACYRVLFAGLVLTPTLRKADLRFHPLMIVMAICFAGMNILFISAMALGPAANAIYLQYSAPLWMFLVGVFCLGEKANRRGVITLFLGLVGIVIIVAGGGFQEGLSITLLGLGSGLAYAGVVLCLRELRDLSPSWLTVWNHLWGGAVLLPVVLWLRPPTGPQWIVLAIYGAVQMALPYWLMARGLKSISPLEAGTITLLEPILNPLWAYLVSPTTEIPSAWTFAGGGVILSALAWRYWPGWRSGRR